MNYKLNKRQAMRHLELVLICAVTALILGDIIAYLAYLIMNIFNQQADSQFNPNAIAFLFGPLISIVIFALLYRSVILLFIDNKSLAYPINLPMMVAFMTMLYIVPIFFLVVLTLPWWFKF